MSEDPQDLVKSVDRRLANADAEELIKLIQAREEILRQNAMSDPVQAMNYRIANSEDPRDLILAAQVRGEIIRQNEAIKDREHQRKQETIENVGKIALAIAAFGAGTWLVPHGYPVPGLLILGAALYNLAPKYVMAALKKLKRGRNDE